MEEDGTFAVLPKKEVIGLKKEYDKLNRVLCGIREMFKLPNALIVVDPSKDHNAIREARKLNIPVFGIVDTNCDPDDVDFVIPGNDDAVRSVKVVLGVLGNAICEPNNLEMLDFISDDDKRALGIKIEKPVEETASVETPVADGEIVEALASVEPVKETTKEVVEKTEEVVEPTEEAIELEPTEDLSTKTLSALKSLAKEAGIKGYSTMKKDQIITALSE